jgi:hypothetical protein
MIEDSSTLPIMGDARRIPPFAQLAEIPKRKSSSRNPQRGLAAARAAPGCSAVQCLLLLCSERCGGEQDGTPSNSRARAMLAARLPLANTPSVADAVQANGQHVHQKAPK